MAQSRCDRERELAFPRANRRESQTLPQAKLDYACLEIYLDLINAIAVILQYGKYLVRRKPARRCRLKLGGSNWGAREPSVGLTKVLHQLE